jgi:hypothetical protein
MKFEVDIRPIPCPKNNGAFTAAIYRPLSGELWESSFPVAWVAEMGRRITQIHECALVRRWLFATHRCSSLHT